MSSVEFPVKGNVIGNPLTVFLASGASRIPVSSLRWNNSPSFKKNSKKFEVINKSVVDVQVSWKISPKSYTPDSSSLFSISPSTMIIGSYKAAMFNVTFHPEGGGTFQVNLIGDTIVVDPHQIQLQDFNNPPPLSIELIGHSVAP